MCDRFFKRHWFVLWLIWFISAGEGQEIPSPEAVLGFQPGADFRLARWEQIVDYFYKIGSLSQRVHIEEIGRTTEDNPYILAVISDPKVIADLELYQSYQRKLSHPHEIESGEKDDLLDQAKTVVLISCSLHSNEIGASQMAMELLHELASLHNERIREILDNVILLLVPSANPDGINKEIDWYERSLGKPWEGQGMPWLYQKYCGHDNNRDWFMLTQKETQILTQILYQKWYPCVLYDIHQMGNQGSRFFVPPFYDPINPNVDPLIHESLKMIGGHIATDLTVAGKAGVVTNAIFDNWWQGGNRTTPYRHNIIGILTEAASPRLASPLFQPQGDLTGQVRGLPRLTMQVNYANPWKGGWWRLRDVVEYEKIACYSLLTLAARYRDQLNHNYLALGEKAIRLGREEPPFAYLIPPDQRDFPTAVHMAWILREGGVQINIAETPFAAEGAEYPAGTYIIYASQPYRNYILDLLEPQHYPERSLYPGGPAEPPYDVAGWTLPMQMGVRTVRVDQPFPAQTRPLDSISLPPGRIQGNGTLLISPNTTNYDFIVLNRAWKQDIPVFILQSDWSSDSHTYPAGSLVYSPGDSRRTALEGWIHDLGLTVGSIPATPGALPDGLRLKALRKPRIAMYQPWTANIDEGWTRFVLEQFEFEYTTLHNAAIRAGDLRRRFDAIILPDIHIQALLNGRDMALTAPEYAGGIGEEGITSLQEFVELGGSLLCLDSSTRFAIRFFDLPVKNVLEGVGRDKFYCPGSILRINLDPSRPLAYGMRHRAAAYFVHSQAFEITHTSNRDTVKVRMGEPIVLASYDKSLTLLSGWIQGEELIHDKAAIVSVPYGQGQVILYGFRVQHRAQTHGTFRLLFNGLLFSGPNR